MTPFPYPQHTSVCVISNFVHRTPLSFSLKYNATKYAYPIVRVDLQAVGCICVTYSFDAAWGNSEISDTRSRKWFTMNVPDPEVAFQAPGKSRNLESLNKYKFSKFLWKFASLSSWYSLKLLNIIYTINRSTAVHGDRGNTVVKVLCYKSEGRWFDPIWCRWIFHWHKIPLIALWPWGRLSFWQKWVPGVFLGG